MSGNSSGIGSLIGSVSSGGSVRRAVGANGSVTRSHNSSVSGSSIGSGSNNSNRSLVCQREW